MDNRGLLSKDTIEVEADKSISKIVVLAIIGAAFSFFFGYFLKIFLLEGQFNSLLFCFLAGLGFLVFFILDVFFIKTAWLANLIIFLNVAAFSAPFYDRLSQIFGIGALISFLFLIWGGYSGRRELENTLRIKFWRISRKAFPKAMIALALFVAVVYAEVSNFEIGEKEFFISKTTFEKIISPAANLGIIQKFLPGFDLSLPIEKLIENLAVNQAEKNSQFNLLPETAKNQLINQSVADLEKEISNFIGGPLNPQATTSDALYDIIVSKFSGLPANVKSAVPMIMAALIFLIIVSLSYFIRLIVTVLAFLIYEICLALGFSVIMMEGRSKEIIVLK